MQVGERERWEAVVGTEGLVGARGEAKEGVGRGFYIGDDTKTLLVKKS